MCRPQPLRSRFVASLISFAVLFAWAHPSAASAQTSSTQKPTAKSATAAKKPTAKRRYSARQSRTRRAKLAAARAAARAREAREAAEPRYKLDRAGMIVPDLRAEAAIIYNPITGEVLWEENSLNQRSLASITKAMTALVFLKDDPDLDREVVVTRTDVRRASTTYLTANERIRLGDLLHLLLIASDNAAARALARLSPTGPADFIDRMNTEAADLGLVSTQFVDPSGLNSGNVSSAYDISRLIVRAAADERIAAIMRKPEYTFSTSRRRNFTIHNTNKLLDGTFDVRGGKTGFIGKSGYCLATLLNMPGGDQVAVVVLGAKSNAGRFWETRHLLNWLSSKATGWLGSMQLQTQPQQ